ncbi:hypothetical protein VMCG_04578 [Cytospora schulzeri]|uniref:Uncharacterized protein n=1 Tax=Cytospora schulzeri TaxID=448051 RepID=A0A423WSD3_9PEZI|nr:hypothetical protein VMCG_04578 [Valsa malicola]
MPANFRTEEGMRRLLTAVIAAHDVKLNYKEIAKYFGESTPDGIQWQFRQIKRDAEAMKQGKGASDNTPTATPKSNRKRSATSAPSTGKSTAKKARGSAVKPIESNVINLDDDDSEHSPIQTPTKSRHFKINYDMERESYAKMGYDYDTGAPLTTAAPSLDLTHPDSPNNDEDIKPVTPGDAPSYSFAQPTQPSAGGEEWNMWGNNSFGVGNTHFPHSGPQKSYVADEFEDDFSEHGTTPPQHQPLTCFIAIPQILVSRHTLRHIGFTDAKAWQVWRSWFPFYRRALADNNYGDDDNNNNNTTMASAFKTFVCRLLNRPEPLPQPRSEDAQDWVDYLNRLGMNLDVKMQIMDPVSRELARLSGTSCGEMAEQHVMLRYGELVRLQRGSLVREGILRVAKELEQAGAGSVGGCCC